MISFWGFLPLLKLLLLVFVDLGYTAVVSDADLTKSSGKTSSPLRLNGIPSEGDFTVTINSELLTKHSTTVTSTSGQIVTREKLWTSANISYITTQIINETVNFTILPPYDNCKYSGARGPDPSHVPKFKYSFSFFLSLKKTVFCVERTQ